MVRCYCTWDWWGETVSMTRTKTLCGGRSEISAVLKALLDWEIQVKGLNCYIFLKREKLFSTELLRILSPSSPAPSSAVAPCCHLPFCRTTQLFAAKPQQRWGDIIAFEGWRAGSQGRCLGTRITASEGLAAELLQRSAITCSRGSTGSCLPPVPPSPRPLVAGIQSCWRLARRMCVCIAFQGVGVN